MFRIRQSTHHKHLHILSSNFPRTVGGLKGLDGNIVQCGHHGGLDRRILGSCGRVAKLCFVRNIRARKAVWLGAFS